jgi:hypothetical protein
MLGSALAHARRSRIVLSSRDAVLEAHVLAARRRMREPVVLVAAGTSEVGRQIVARTRRDPTVLVMPEAELLLSFVQSRREFFHRLSALVAETKHVDGQIRVLVCAEGGVELSLWTDQLSPLQQR